MKVLNITEDEQFFVIQKIYEICSKLNLIEDMQIKDQFELFFDFSEQFIRSLVLNINKKNFSLRCK
jgi:hypothetical protein